MKRLFSALLIGLMLLTFMGCSAGGYTPESSSDYVTLGKYKGLTCPKVSSEVKKPFWSTETSSIGRIFPPKREVAVCSVMACGISWVCCAMARWCPAAWITRETLPWEMPSAKT